ncbi:MAG: GNAT family N-acetyltransferase [Candidatus Rokubacteria bacterium]|nr:GNAT family N-acetyltransferase [Candidatus Rokubacteria bacterium]
MTAVDFRPARPADAATLTRIAHASKRYWRYPEDLMLQWKDALTVSEDSMTESPVVCAVRGGQIVGFYALSGAGGTRELEHFWVAPDHIGDGIGTRMFEQVLVTLRDAGARMLRIASDPNAEGFYRRMGARREGDVPSTPEGRRLPLLVFDLRAP